MSPVSSHELLVKAFHLDRGVLGLQRLEQRIGQALPSYPD